MDRRQFIGRSTAALGSIASLGAAGQDPAQGPAAARKGEASSALGRPVRAVSISFSRGLSVEQIAGLVDKEGARGTDIIALPEGAGRDLDGALMVAVGGLAAKHRTYVVCPISRADGDGRLNSAVLLDRRGQLLGIYDKMYPYWSEFARDPVTKPGQAVKVFQTDFGRVGLAICYDVNWAPLWQRLGDFGAELVIWPSAYSAGRSLQARATDFNYYIMSSTQVPDCLVYDIDGEELVYEHNNVADNTNVTRFTFDLDRCVFHQDFNLPTKLAKLLKEHGDDVVREKWEPKEGWFVLKAKRPGVSARELARQGGLEERRPYINRSRCELDRRRGWQFS